MAHRVSPKGIVGMGALGQAIELFIPDSLPTAAVIFAVKAFDLEQALLEQSKLWPEHLPFVTLCNGYIWPIITRIRSRLGDRPIRIGMTTIGSTVKPGGNLHVFSEGTTTAWGHWPEPNTTIIPPNNDELQLLKRFPGGIWQDDIRPHIRRKWILNVVINSVAAANRLPQNALLKSHKTELLLVLEEATDLADKLWPSLLWEQGEKDSFEPQLFQVIDATAGNENSMVRDVKLGRRTESEFLAGMAQGYQGFLRLKELHSKISRSL